MTAADRIARLRGRYGAGSAEAGLILGLALGLCDDYETLAARCKLTDEETEAVRAYIAWFHPHPPVHIQRLLAILRRLVGEAQ